MIGSANYYQEKQMKDLEKYIRSELQRIRSQITRGDDSELVLWVIPGELALSQRPLRDHPQFGGHSPLPPEARPLVVDWVERIKNLEIQSVICLLEPAQLDKYYIRGELNLHEHGLLGYYESQGLLVRHFPMTDYQKPPESEMQEVLEAFDDLPKPVLLHCSAAIDRTTPVAAFIFQYRGEK
jgi:hypothetical protein